MYIRYIIQTIYAKNRFIVGYDHLKPLTNNIHNQLKSTQ